MKGNHSDSGQKDLSESLTMPSRLKRHLTWLRFVVAVLVVTVLIYSLMSLFLNTGNSSAHVNNPFIALDTSTPTDTPTDTPTPTVGVTPSPTDTPMPQPTPTTPPPVKTPTPRPPVVTYPTPTDTPDPTPTATVSPTATAKVTPTVTPTHVAAVLPTGNNGNGNDGNDHNPSDGGGGPNILLIIFFSIVGLAVCAGVGLLFFRRALLPTPALNSKLPPSGAHPWSRSRVPNPNSLAPNQYAGSPMPGDAQGNLAAAAGLAATANAFSSFNASQGMETPQAFSQGAYGTPIGGMGGFGDSFIPASPQFFAQNDPNLPPPGSGAYPLSNQNNGYAPASNGFSAMYGLPDDTFSPMQNGAPGWMAGIMPSGTGQVQRVQPPQQNSGNFGAPTTGQLGAPMQQSGNFGSPMQTNSGNFGSPLSQNSGRHRVPFQQNSGNFGAPMPQNSGNFGSPLPPNSGNFGSPMPQPSANFGTPGTGQLGRPSQQLSNSFTSGQVDLNDPELEEIIRRYSQKSQALRPQPTPPPEPPQQGIRGNSSDWIR